MSQRLKSSHVAGSHPSEAEECKAFGHRLHKAQDRIWLASIPEGYAGSIRTSLVKTIHGWSAIAIEGRLYINSKATDGLVVPMCYRFLAMAYRSENRAKGKRQSSQLE
jgi:hypothetical protein